LAQRFGSYKAVRSMRALRVNAGEPIGRSVHPELLMRFALAICLLALPVAADAASPITGRWLTQGGKALVAIEPCGAALCGRVERVLKARPGATGRDSNNPDPALRARPMVGVSILSGFSDAGSEWRGRIYNPEDGRSYKSFVSRERDGSLKVKGCVAFICKTQRWTQAG
jgi:uncharacterized protein (DUF2147 family)